jgi:Rrf2 family protein
MYTLSKKCLYAMHALIYMAGSSTPTVQVNWIARARKIPKKFLEVIMLDLKKAQILGSKQGKGGGYFLKKNPGEISLLEIINIIDGGFFFLPCLASGANFAHCQMCGSEDNCPLHHKFGSVMNETNKILTNTSIIEFVKIEKEIIKQG